jgi:hypothetical protein
MDVGKLDRQLQVAFKSSLVDVEAKRARHGGASGGGLL